MFDPEEYKKQRKLARTSFKVEQVPEKTLLLIKQGFSTMEESFETEIPEEILWEWSEAGLKAELKRTELGRYTYHFTF